MNQVQQQQIQQPVAPQGQQGGGTSASGSTQSTIAYPHSTYRSTQSQSTVRRVYDIGNSEFEGEVNMLQITDHETEYYIIDDDLLTTSTRTSTTWDDDSHQWFNHKLDIDDHGHFMNGEFHSHGRADQRVRVVLEEIPEEDLETIILDSGSDVSLLPKKFYREDRDLGNQHRLQDCQGRRLNVAGTRETEIEVMDANGEMVTLRHRFLVGEVTSCLLSLGQLLKSGWTLNHDEHQKNKLLLCSPDREAAIPVGYRGMSLAIEGTVRKIEKENTVAEDDDEPQIRLHVRKMVQSKEGHGIETEPNNLWRHCDAEMVFIKSLSNKFYDTKTTWGERFTFRSTFIRELNELPGPARRWQMVEFCEDISKKENRRT